MGVPMWNERGEVLRLLVIEDDNQRIRKIWEWLPADFHANFVKNGGRALGVITRDGPWRGRRDEPAYAGIMLDFDLNMQSALASDLDLSGKSVVLALLRYMRRDIPILVHSMNPAGAPLMVNQLKDAGFDVIRIPWSDLEQPDFVQWLDEVLENWRDNWNC